MITNELQLRVTKAALREFETALKEIASDTDLPALTKKTDLAAIRSEIESLSRQVRQYENIRSGRIGTLQVDFFDLGDALMLARVSAGLTQKQLAERVGVKEPQIQRYEAKEYEQASLARIKEIVHVLNCDINLHVVLPGATQVSHHRDETLTAVAVPAPIDPAAYPVTGNTESDMGKILTLRSSAGGSSSTGSSLGSLGIRFADR